MCVRVCVFMYCASLASSSFDTGNDDDEPHRVVIDRQPGQSLGMSIAGGIGSVTGDVPIFIASVQPEGLAASTKSIHVSGACMHTLLHSL